MAKMLFTIGEEGIEHKCAQRYSWVIETIKRKYPKKKKITVLDIACGVGYGSWLMAREGFHVHAVDRYQKAKDIFDIHWKHPNIQFIFVDIKDFEPTVKKYDAIISLETIEHLKEDRIFIEKMKDFSSLWFISVPNENTNHWSPRKQGHKRHYTKDQLNQLLPGGKKSWFTTHYKQTKYKMVPIDKEEGKHLGVIWERNNV